MSLDHQQIKQLREAGYVVIVFNPEELEGANPRHVQDRLVEMGWDVIQALAPQRPVVLPGQKYISLRDELDGPDPDDETAKPYLNADDERITPAGSEWEIVRHNHRDVWDLVCGKTGACICPTEAELRRDFKLVEGT